MPVPLNEVKVQQQDGKNENDTPNTAPVPKIQSKKPPMPPPSSSTSDNDGEKRRSIHSAPPARDDQPIDDVEKRKAEEAEKRQRAQREADEKQRAEERRVAEQQLEQKRLADQAAEEACIQREADAKRAAIDAEAKRVADERQAQLDKQAAQQKQQEQQVKKSEEESDRQQMISSAQSRLKSLVPSIGIAVKNGPPTGVLVSKVREDSSASRAGLSPGVIIYSVDNVITDNNDDFLKVMTLCAPGEELDIVIGQPESVDQRMTVKLVTGAKDVTFAELRDTAGVEFCRQLDDEAFNRITNYKN